MHRYFFHVVSDDINAPDLVGIELKGVAEARGYAEAKLREVWAQRVLSGRPPLTGWLEVVDQQDRAVLRLPL